MPVTQGHLEFPDLFMIGGYFALMLGIGAYFYRRMRRMKDYFSGGNRIPWWLSGVSFYMTSFSVAAFVFYPSLCYRYGWVGVTLLWVAIPATLFSALLFAARWRRARIDSPVEYLEMRYSPLLRQLFAWQGVPVKIIDDGIKLFATGTFISICAGIDIRYSILAAGGIILLYTFMGGLWAVAVTDFIQFVVLAVGVGVILPLSVARAGGLGAIVENAPAGFFRPTTAEFGWSYVIPLILLYALAWSSINWSLIQRYYCVPKERDALKVGWLVVALYLVGPPLMFFPAIAATRFLPGVEDAGTIYPMICRELLPAGMLGLAVAAMFAATMSTLSSDYNVCAGVLTNDVYRRLIRPRASQSELVLVGRIMTLLVGVIALGAGVLMARGKAEDMFRVMVTLFGVATAPVAVPMLLGLVSRKATNLGAVLGFLFGIGVGLNLFFLSRYRQEVEFLGILWDPSKQELLFWGLALKMEIVLFLSTALMTLVVMLAAGALAPADCVAQERADAFLARLRMPIGRLPEDEDAESVTDVPSPFGVVGVSLLLIGGLLLAVAPWWRGGLVVALDVALALVLMAVGGAFLWLGRSRLAGGP
ncbi:MAG TPA: hypothetical protein PKI11_05535 [Candidatus Hydrogenedentes bacterium]|nr:hypothetical protein [Candidatus Hydrogenedentota bacterium]HNT86824.1 hypothetical protein [Candidatus Hydrogenedentota bacterium]